MSPAASKLARPATISGMGTLRPPGNVPPPPLTEVIPAPEVRPEPGAASPIPKPRPSETLVGSQAPLHTAEEANTAVDISSLTPADAERILAGVDAERVAHAARPPVARTAPGTLPPPPPLLRPNSSPPPPLRHPGSVPPAAPQAAQPGGLSSLTRPASARPPAPSPLASPPAARSSYPPPPPPRRGGTLLLYGGADGTAPVPPPTSAPSSQAAGAGSIRALLSRGSPSEPPRPPPAPVDALSAPRPREDSAVELSSGLLMDDSSELNVLARVPAQPISSSSLVEDPGSSPELELDEDPPPPIVAHAPRVNPSEPEIVPLPVAADLGDRTFPALGAEAAGLELEAAEAPTGSARLPLPVLPPRQTGAPIILPIARPAWVAPALVIGGAFTLALTVGVAAFAIKWVHGKLASADGPVSPTPSAVAAESASSEPGAATAPSASSVAAAEGESPGKGGQCVLAGAPHIVAPRALLKTGIETASTADQVALGVGLGDLEGFVVALDPTSFAAVATTKARATEPIRRVVPLLSPLSDLAMFLETPRRRDPIQSAHPVVADPPFVLGVANRKLVWAPSTSVDAAVIWPLASDTPVDAIRAAPLPGHAGYAVAFRQGTSIYVGSLHADKTADGELVRIGGLGAQIGAPALAVGKREAFLAWADRPGPTAPWAIRWLHWLPGKEPGEPTAFSIPAGGAGGQAMAPALTSLADGRMVMVWTEGIAAKHEVRAQALTSTGRPIGNAITVSADGVNAGQGMPALTPDGRGAVVFLATPTGTTASVVAVPVVCPAGG